jgi:3-(3-hydroxy-phenyl)propionate hydroxylase
VPVRMISTQAAIVGAGPTGATIANYLGMYGVDTVLIDRSTDVIDYPRAVGMDDECLRSFQAIGLADELLPHIIQNVALRFFDAHQRCFATVRPATQEFGWSRRNIFLQQQCERVLRGGIMRYPSVKVLLGHHVQSLEQDDSHAVLGVLTPDGDSMRIRADYVVGADGGRSTIRGLLGIAFGGDTHPRQWVVVECDNDPLDAPYTALHCDPARPHVSVRLPHGYRRWEFMLLPGEDAREMLAAGKLRDLLCGQVADPSRLNIIRARSYTHHSRIAARFTVGRVCLAGDAAHLMPPWAGQGMNTGIRDATNLAWKIAAVIQGRVHPSILWTYEAERRPHAKAMINLSTTLGRILSPTSQWLVAARDVFFQVTTRVPGVTNWILQMQFKPMPQYRDGVVAPHGGARSPVGRMFIQPTVDMPEGRQVRLDDALGTGFAVLGYDIDPAACLSQEDRAFLATFHTTYVKVVDARPGQAKRETHNLGTLVAEDTEGHLREWFLRSRGRIAVIRPDRYLAALTDEHGIGPAIQQLRQLLDPKGDGWTAAGGKPRDRQRGHAR